MSQSSDPGPGLPPHEQRIADIQNALRTNTVPSATRARLEASRAGRLPWLATLTPAELMVVRSHGLKPIAAVSATCWLHYGYSWTDGHAQGWESALSRLRAEAKAAGANAVLDVKMRTIPLEIQHSMDFTLVGTAVYVEGLPPSNEPIVATVPALEFVKLLEADVVATGIAIGAHYDWLNDWRNAASKTWGGNVESAGARAVLGEDSASRACPVAPERGETGQWRAGACQFRPDVRVRGQRQPAEALPRPPDRDRDHGRYEARPAVSA